MLKLIPFCLLSSLILISCEKDPDPITEPTPSNDVEVSADDMMLGLQEFQWTVFQKTVAEGDMGDNILISPLSIASALYMATEGSASDTKKGMLQGLSIPFDKDATLETAYAALSEALKPTSEGVSLTTVNGVFYDEGRIQPHQAFMDKMTGGFGAEESMLDFSRSDAVESINQWVKRHTNQKIDKIIEQIKDYEAMFLINAIHFKGDWSNPFVEELTARADFTIHDGTVKEVNMMYQDVFDLKSFADESLQAVEKTFADTNYSMVFIQPKTDLLKKAIADISFARITDLLNEDLHSGRVLFYLPKFEVDYKHEMSPQLKDMGMDLAFSDFGADFSKLGTAAGNIFLSRVEHKTFLSIDEKGAEGAAVTSVGVGVTSLPPVFRFDRPFIYLIRNRNTSSFIFIGKLEVPPQ